MQKLSKKGYSTGFSWIYALVSVFGLGVLYIVFNQVLTVSLVPTIKAMTNTSAVPPAIVAQVFAGIDKYMDYFNFMPYVLFLVVIFYMVVTSYRREGESRYV